MTYCYLLIKQRNFCLQGQPSDVHSLCWDTNGDLLASVSQDAVRVWSLSSGECIHELNSSGNMFQSCVFHPSYCTLLVIGGYQVKLCFLFLLLIGIELLLIIFFMHLVCFKFYQSGNSKSQDLLLLKLREKKRVVN